MKLPPRSRARYEGKLLVQWVDETGFTTIGFATREELDAAPKPNCGECCHRPEPLESYVVIGTMKRGKIEHEDGKTSPVEKWCPGEWRD